MSNLEQYLQGNIKEGTNTLPEVLTPEILKQWRERPSTIRIETINKCNASCLFCGYPKMKRKKKAMTKKLFTKIINDCAEWNPRMVRPYLHGELFCDPKWKDRLQYINDNLTTSIQIETNGSLLDTDAIEFLMSIDKLKVIGFNVSGTIPSKYEEIMGLKYAKVRDNIIAFIDAIKRTRKPMDVYTVMVADASYHTISDGQQYRKAWGPLARTNMHFNYGGLIEERKLLHGACQGLNELCILSNGKTGLCWFDIEGEESIGDANKEDLIDIWNSSRAIELRSLHKDGKRGDIPICNRCNFQ